MGADWNPNGLVFVTGNGTSYDGRNVARHRDYRPAFATYVVYGGHSRGIHFGWPLHTDRSSCVG